MKTPLSDAVKAYVEEKRSRFHTPGHQGVLPEPFSEIAKYDVTEIEGLDDLYNASGAIKSMEQGFAKIYGSSSCVFSAGGSTLCIQTMLALAVPIGGSVIISREVHTSAVNAMALLDITPVWAYPKQNEKTGILEPVTARAIEALLKQHSDVSAVYITSPTYHGRDADIAAISKVCKQYGKPLLVDAAQGAHYKFFESSKFALDLGADICCVSLHKTLPAMTGAALLHLGRGYSYEAAKHKMALFGSTSPSYPIMLSADRLLPYLSVQAEKDFEKARIQVDLIKMIAKKSGFIVPDGDCDPTRLTLGYGAVGYTQKEILKLLREHLIEAEYIDDYYFVLFGGVNHTIEDWKHVADFLRDIKKRAPRELPDNSFPIPKQVKSIREAVFSEQHSRLTLTAKGCISGSVLAPCPPGIPILIPGELIDEAVLENLKKHRIMTIDVL